MTSNLLSVNLVLAEGAKDTGKAVNDLPNRVLEKAFKDPSLPLEAVKRKQTSMPNLIKIPQMQTTGNSAGYQQKPFYQQQGLNYKESFQQKKAHPSNDGPQTQYRMGQQSHQTFQKKEKKEWSILRLSVKKQGVMEDILELGSFLSLSGSHSGRGRGGGFAGVPHHPKCLARLIYNTRYYGGHFGVGFSSFASGWPRSASGRGLLGVSGRGTPPPKMSGKVNSWYLEL